jgi:methionine biosynthesis protein MetW
MRLSLLAHGRMPVTHHLPISWYETQNIHHVTVTDFRELLAVKGVRVERSWFFNRDREIGSAAANWRAEYAVFLLSR